MISLKLKVDLDGGSKNHLVLGTLRKYPQLRRFNFEDVFALGDLVHSSPRGVHGSRVPDYPIGPEPIQLCWSCTRWIIGYNRIQPDYTRPIFGSGIGFGGLSSILISAPQESRPQVDCSRDTTPPSTASPSTTPPSHFASPPNHYASPPTHTAFRLRLLRLPPSHRVQPLCISAEPLRFFVEPLRVPPLCLRLRRLPPAHRVPPLREAPITAQSVVDSSLVRLPPLREDTARRDTRPPPSSTPHAEPLHLPPLRSDTTAVTESITTYPLCCQPAPFPQFKSKP
ncbi:hypothetical protein PIB30_074112 [Stylosanthes scabra]|uniref:Uncharacterized protein n=1 Tax=Stylosanthes scabra TaxID=79078 RepID=A0ABU6YM53_9FABA|nr:hypothetical protein [Stylosanthes scabra]